MIDKTGAAAPTAFTNPTSKPIKGLLGEMVPPHETVWYPGLTKRQYAAILLRDPNSGEEWLDAMITRSWRRDVAAQMAAAMLSSPNCPKPMDGAELAHQSYVAADAVLRGGE